MKLLEIFKDKEVRFKSISQDGTITLDVDALTEQDIEDLSHIRINLINGIVFDDRETTNDKDKSNDTESLYMKLVKTYIKETADVDGQLFCGCRQEDCTDYMRYSECQKCLERYLKEDVI